MAFRAWHKRLPWHEYQFVVIGSGPAGLYLAEGLSPFGKVLVIEAGPLGQTDGAGAGYYEYDSTGEPYPTSMTRLSMFGGTSNHWGGNSFPLSAELFHPRIGMAPWPISYEDYSVHLDDAARFLNLRPFTAPSPPTSIETGILAGYKHLNVARFQYADPIRRLGDIASRRDYRLNKNIDVLVDTRVVDLDLSVNGDRLDAIELLHRPSRERVKVRIGRAFLATGGIENARLMLWAGRKYGHGNPLLGGPNQLTGTHFTDHVYISPVEVFLDGRADMSDASTQNLHPAWELSEGFRREHGLTRFGVFPERGELVVTDDPDLNGRAQDYLDQSSSYVKLSPAFQFEQTPTPDSRVELSSRLDEDGFPIANVRWRLLEGDLAAFRRGVMLFCGILNQKGFAKTRVYESHRDEVWTRSHVHAGFHPMGTTRMGDTAADGVVDTDSRVFGLANLFVVGSSVFPSGDYVNPTLNLVALAGRLATHIGGSSWRARLKFGKNGADNKALLSGWSRLEDDGVWTDGLRAHIVVAVPDMQAIVLSGHGFYDTKGTVSINGRRVFSGYLDDAMGKVLKFRPKDSVDIRIRVEHPTTPKARGESDDARSLGMFITGLQVR